METKISGGLSFFHLLATFLIVIYSIPGISQSNQQLQSEDSKLRNELLFHLPRLIENNYVFPEEGQKIATHLTDKVKSGYFNQFRDRDSFAKALTNEVRSINGDLHLSIQAVSPVEKEAEDKTFSAELIEEYFKLRSEFNGFNAVQNLNKGVGYLKLNLFRNSAKNMADDYMRLLQYSDALIIDLRNNHGGTVEMVQYLLSYFFEKPILISTIFGREGPGKEHWTLDTVRGKKLSEVPLFILVNHETASGAEGFAYVIKNNKRGLVIGETTMGAAHSGANWYINGYSIFIPNERSISPITGTNWEETGVVPDRITEVDKELEVALDLAKVAALEHKGKSELLISKKMDVVDSLLRTVQETIPQPELISKVRMEISNLSESGILNESKINDWGYAYMEEKTTRAAEVIFEVNTELYPRSSNACDSYAECLALNGKLEKSILIYERAIRLAIEYNNGNEVIYQRNLEKVKTMKSAKKG